MKGFATVSIEIFSKLEHAVYAALETYSNVHRGSGHYSMASTALFEHAREIVREHLGVRDNDSVVIFCTPHHLDTFKVHLKPTDYRVASSCDLGLPLGVKALAVKRESLPDGVPFQTGGGVVKLVSPGSIVWANAPDRFEAGTPGIVNVIAFAKALQLTKQFGRDMFKEQTEWTATAAEVLYLDEFLEDSGKDLLGKLKKTLIGRNVRVPTKEGEVPYTNLDNGASTPTFTPIWDVVRHTWRQPEDVQQKIVCEVKDICAEFVGAPLETYDLIFTSNTTEALNFAAQRLVGHVEEDTEPVVVNTLLEHHSNELPWRYLPDTSLIRLPVNGDGFLSLDDLEHCLREYNQEHRHGKKRICLVAVCGASNVLGSYNDLHEISRIVHMYGARVLVDGAQLVAHRKVNMMEDGIDCLAFSGHKMYAPFGAGALVVRKGLLTTTELKRIKASGEENVVGIAAMGKAIMLLQRIGVDVIEEEEHTLTRRLVQGLARVPGIEIFGLHNPDSPEFQHKGGTVVFSLRGVPHNLVAKELAEQGGIGVRNGCFCAHMLVKHLLNIHPVRSAVAAAIMKLLPGLSDTASLLPGLIRVSLGIENQQQDVDHFIDFLEQIANIPRSPVNKFIASQYNGTPFMPHTELQEKMKEFTKTIIERVYSHGKR